MTNEDKKYNGWTNYETWNYMLWYDDGLYNDIIHDIYEHVDRDDSTFDVYELTAFELMEVLKNDIEEFKPEVTGFYADIMNAAISEVNFYECAMHMIEDMKNELQDDNNDEDTD